MPTETYHGEADGWHSFLDDALIPYGGVGGGGGGGGGLPAGWNSDNGTMFGFNIKPGYDSSNSTPYNPAGETAAAMNTRLVSGYGDFLIGKEFRSLGVTYSGMAWPSFPSVLVDIVCQDWPTPGSIANGSSDSLLDASFSSVPAGHIMVFSYNEVDGKFSGTQKTSYINDMNYAYDYKEANGPYTGDIWVADCLRGSQIISGALDITTWMNPAKRDAVILDCYQNNYSVDTTGSSRYGAMAAAAAEVGLPWFLGETGDRRPGSDTDVAANDSQRASRWTTRLDTLVALDPPPLGMVWFNVHGSTGDHRILQSTMSDQGSVAGPDTATIAVYAGFVATSRGE